MNYPGELKSNKVIVGFAESFWPADIGVFTMTTAKGEEPGILQTWFNMQNLVGRPYLIGTIYGNAAVEMEKMPVEELKLKGKSSPDWADQASSLIDFTVYVLDWHSSNTFTYILHLSSITYLPYVTLLAGHHAFEHL